MPVHLHICSAPADDALRDQLEQHLATLRPRIRVWHTGSVPPGADEPAERARSLAAAQIILILVSADLMSWMEHVEAALAERARGAVVLPVLLRPVLWQATLFGSLRPLPADGRPVTSWTDPHQALVSVAAEIQALCASMEHPDPSAALRSPPAPLSEFDPTFYVQREREERAALARLRRPAAAAVVLQGPLYFGKTTLLSHLLTLAGERSRVFRVHLGHLQQAHPDDFTTLDRLLRLLGLRLLEQAVGGMAERCHQATFGRAGPTPVLLTELLERYLLPRGEPVLLALEAADRVHGQPYQASFFALLRSWLDPRRGPWDRLRLLLTLSTEPMRLESTDHSSFFLVAQSIIVKELARPQVERLAALHGVRPEPAELDRLIALCGGHPYLLRLAFHEAAVQGCPLSELDLEGELFTPFLERLRRYVDEHGLRPSICRLVEAGAAGAALEDDDYCRLYSQGLVIRDDVESYRLRAPLYARYFRRLCQRHKGRGATP